MSFYIYDRYMTEGFITFANRQITDSFIERDGGMQEHIDWHVANYGLDVIHNADGSFTLEHTFDC